MSIITIEEKDHMNVAMKEKKCRKKWFQKMYFMYFEKFFPKHISCKIILKKLFQKDITKFIVTLILLK